jgi:hypothetical protein
MATACAPRRGSIAMAIRDARRGNMSVARGLALLGRTADACMWGSGICDCVGSMGSVHPRGIRALQMQNCSMKRNMTC